MNEERSIYVYADWVELNGIKPLGIITVQRIRGKEIFSFEYHNDWLEAGQALYLDPDLGLFQGKQYLNEGRSNFGMFLDSSPDRWGRLLMRRRESAMAKAEDRRVKDLLESDYLLGVFDGHRMGGLRFKLDPEGDFLNNQKEMASPPWTSLRELEFASLQLEREDAVNDPAYLQWLKVLVDPGSSLGGARPKASVIDTAGSLWIAKFPSSMDEKDSGAWEMVLHSLASNCGIHVPEVKLLRFTGKHHTFLSKRFDRTADRKRIHFASSMTLLGHQDGVDFMDGVSYLEMVTLIIRQGGLITSQLEELWRRVVFNVLVSNTDDHLRNHGFLLSSNGWVLSPAYDMNPNEYGTGLKLNISPDDNQLDISLPLSVAKYFRLDEQKANRILLEMMKAVKEWRSIAKLHGISQGEIERVKDAFRLVN